MTHESDAFWLSDLSDRLAARTRTPRRPFLIHQGAGKPASSYSSVMAILARFCATSGFIESERLMAETRADQERSPSEGASWRL